jgi:hypothetical protein
LDLNAILNGLSPTAAIACVAFVAIKWKQISTNTECITKIKNSLDKMNEKVEDIHSMAVETKGYIEGLRNGKK